MQFTLKLKFKVSFKSSLWSYLWGYGYPHHDMQNKKEKLLYEQVSLLYVNTSGRQMVPYIITT